MGIFDAIDFHSINCYGIKSCLFVIGGWYIFHTQSESIMFKSKVDFNAFDTNNEKVKNLEETQVKALSKNSVKKLLNSPDTRTPFHLILDYFKDDKGKGLGHFVGFGVNKKLDKHFEQVEMKSGKLDKSMSASQKEASMGEAYAKEEGGKKLLCFEPSPKSKIPKGKWPKILKGLKPFLAGAKAVVIIDGTVVGDETELPEENTGETTDTDTQENAPQEETTNTSTDTTEESQEPTGEETTDTGNLVEQFKAQLQDIANSLKQTLPKDIIPKIKDKTVEAADLEIVNDIKNKINEFEEAYTNAAENIQSKLTKMRDSIAKQAPKVDQIIQAVEKLLGSVGAEDASTTGEDTSTIQELLDMARQGLDEFNNMFDQLKSDLENSTSEPLPEGEALLEQVG